MLFKTGVGGKSVGVHHQHAVVRPGISEFTNPLHLVSGRAIDRDKMLPGLRARVNLGGDISDSRKSEDSLFPVDSRHADGRPARASERLVDTVEQCARRKTRIQMKHADRFQRRSLGFETVAQSIRHQDHTRVFILLDSPRIPANLLAGLGHVDRADSQRRGVAVAGPV